MAADASDISKVDSAIAGMEEKKRRTTSSAPGVMNLQELGMISLTHSPYPSADTHQRRKAPKSLYPPIPREPAGTLSPFKPFSA
jgi:hypothetical protein